MSANAKHTLLNLEVAPPEGMWESIAARLDTEFDATEIKVSEKIAGFEWAPPTGVWEKVSAQLGEHVPATIRPQAAPVRALWKWLSAAAVLILLFGAWFFYFEKNTTTSSVTDVQPDLPARNTPATPAPNDQVQSNNLPEVEPDRPLPPRRIPNSGRPRKSYNAMIVSNAGFIPPPAEDLIAGFTANLRAAEPDAIQAERITTQPRVIAPPIRDAHGNIILDTHLIFSSDNQYIIVTSPNGEQTRISAKFLPLLISMNGNMESLEYIHNFLNENNMWKMRFNEWRNKMLSDPSFIPAATNFLDLLELKELLQENQ